MAMMRSTGAAGQELLQELEDEITGKRKGVEWPWLHMRNMFGTIRPGEFTVVSGTEGSGKSYLILSLLIHCQNLGLNWYYLPMEESPKYWLRRFLAIIDNDWGILDIDPIKANRAVSAISRHSDTIDDIKGRIFENPRSPIGECGNEYMPDIPWREMAAEIGEAARFADLLVIDPVTMIDFDLDGYDDDDRQIIQNTYQGQSQFVKNIVARIANSKCHLMAVTHTTKDGESIQGHADWGRFSQNSIKMVCHEEVESDIIKMSDICEDIDDDVATHSRTIHLHKVRNGRGSRRSIACDLDKTGPRIVEHGIILKAKKRR